MKKSLWVMLLALLSFFTFAGISQAGQCIYLNYSNGYSCSEVKYSGAIVSFVLYDGNVCERSAAILYVEIDCAKQMWRRHQIDEGWEDPAWYPLRADGWTIVAMRKLCR